MKEEIVLFDINKLTLNIYNFYDIYIHILHTDFVVYFYIKLYLFFHILFLLTNF